MVHPGVRGFSRGPGFVFPIWCFHRGRPRIQDQWKLDQMNFVAPRAGSPEETSSMPRKRDSEVEQWVLRELSLSEIRSCEICVFATDEVVTLRGSAETHQEKLAAEQAARRATGVVGVVNKMRVKPSTALIKRVPFRLVQRPDALVQSKAIQRSLGKTAAA